MRKKKPKPPKQPPPPMTPLERTRIAIAFIASVHLIRRQYDALYLLFHLNGPGRRLLQVAPWIGDAASTAFTIMVYMWIAKLFDPPESLNNSANRNLVLRMVIDEIGGKQGSPERATIEAEYQKLKPTAVKLKAWRNKIGAHGDLIASLAMIEHSMGDGTTPHPAPEILMAELGGAVESLSRIVDTIVKMYVPHIGDWYGNPVGSEVDALARLIK